MAVTDLLLKKIEIDPSVLPRCDGESALTREYTELRRMSVEFPPVVVFKDGDGVHWLSDGVKRCAAEKAIGGEKITADVRKGDQSKARWFATGANREHGSRLTLAERKQGIKNCLNDKDLGEKSDAAIAEHVGVSASTVRNYRKAMEKTKEVKVKKTVEHKATGTVMPKKAHTNQAGGRPSKAKKVAQETKKLKDELGNVLPEFLRGVWADAADGKKLLTELTSLAEKIIKFGRRGSGAGLAVNVEYIADHFKECREGLQGELPYCVCPKCGEKDARPAKCECGGGKTATKFVLVNKIKKAPGWMTRTEYFKWKAKK